MATGKPIKILVTGDVDGKFKELFNRINLVNKKNGPFDMLLCTGNFFPTSEDENNSEKVAAALDDIPAVSVPTFVLGPTNSSQLKYYENLSGCEIKPNITYLGQQGLYTESSGLKLIYLSGIEQKDKKKPKADYEFDENEVHKLQMQFSNTQNQQGVDILMTSQWPEFIAENSEAKPGNPPTQPSSLISSLALLVKPRYHFAGTEGLNYERAPYRNSQVLATACHVTRFIGLGKVGNATKTKWLYAFSITPIAHMERSELIAVPAESTENPFIGKLSLLAEANENQGKTKLQQEGQFFYDSTYTGEDNFRNRGGGRKRNFNQQYPGRDDRQHKYQKNQQQQGQRPPMAPCWFCLASPQVEKHFIISIGESAYLTLAKGGLTPDHVLILPIGHFQSTVECPTEVMEDINKFKKALCSYFLSQSKIVVFYERNFKSPHLQIQCIPLPIDKFGGSSAKTNNLVSLFQDYSESESIELQNVPPNVQIFQLAKPGFPYYFMEIFSTNEESKDTMRCCNKLFAPINRGQQFPLQFGREMLGSEAILNLEHRIDWRQCNESQEEQSQWTQDFRTNFKTFDFTLM